jgi:ribosome maturation factor RimP
VYRDIPEEFKALIEPVVDEHGLELVDLEFAGGRGARLLRFTVDTPSGDGRIDIDRCAKLSREIGTVLDASGIIDESYQLEVSSPGLNRRLTREKDFVASCGSKVQLETRGVISGRRRFRGLLIEFDGDLARIEVEGEEIQIPFAEVAKASVIYEFTSADFAKAGSAKDGSLAGEKGPKGKVDVDRGDGEKGHRGNKGAKRQGQKKRD